MTANRYLKHLVYLKHENPLNILCLCLFGGYLLSVDKLQSFRPQVVTPAKLSANTQVVSPKFLQFTNRCLQARFKKKKDSPARANESKLEVDNIIQKTRKTPLASFSTERNYAYNTLSNALIFPKFDDGLRIKTR